MNKRKSTLRSEFDKELLLQVKKLADEIKDAQTVIAAMRHADAKAPMPAKNLATLHSGIPGILLGIAEMQTFLPDPQWEAIADVYVQELGIKLQSEGFCSISLFSGLSGIGLGILSVSQKNNYPKFIKSITELICTNIQLYTEVDISKGIGSQFFDAIEGISGVIQFLLLVEAKYEVARLATQKLLKQLVDITLFSEQAQAHPDLAWIIPSEWQFTQGESKAFPKGNINTGISHGLAGILLALTRSAEQGIVIDYQIDAIKRIVDTLYNVMLKNIPGYYWPPQIAYEEIMAHEINSPALYRRDAWCYGNPGVSYAMYRAGKLLKDQALCSLMLQIFCESVAKPRGISEPTICHGYAGIYMLTGRMESLAPIDLSATKEKTLRIIGEKVPEMQREEKKIYARMGLLTGDLGVALAIMYARSNRQYMWQHAFSLG